jgi:hypothetical protein
MRKEVYNVTMSVSIDAFATNSGVCLEFNVSNEYLSYLNKKSMVKYPNSSHMRLSYIMKKIGERGLKNDK